jgi:hypothetical protein
LGGPEPCRLEESGREFSEDSQHRRCRLGPLRRSRDVASGLTRRPLNSAFGRSTRHVIEFPSRLFRVWPDGARIYSSTNRRCAIAQARHIHINNSGDGAFRQVTNVRCCAEFGVKQSKPFCMWLEKDDAKLETRLKAPIFPRSHEHCSRGHRPRVRGRRGG